MEKEKILLVDDEPDIVEFLGYNLTQEGYDVTTASNGEEALKLAKKIKPNLIILDVMMPGMDGIETCQEIKKIKELEKILIIFLSARGEDYSQVAGFDAGADDYITKPIRPKLLISKIKAILRRGGNTPLKLKINTKNVFRVDREKYLIYKNEEKLSLPKKEFELLALLLSKQEKVFNRAEIMEKVWGQEVIVGDRTIDVHIRKIREKLEGNYIKTIKGVGYKFINEGEI